MNYNEIIENTKAGKLGESLAKIIDAYENDEIESVDDIFLLKYGIEKVLGGLKKYISDENLTPENNTHDVDFKISSPSWKAPAKSKLLKTLPENVSFLIKAHDEMYKAIESAVKKGEQVVGITYKYVDVETGDVLSEVIECDLSNAEREVKKGVITTNPHRKSGV